MNLRISERQLRFRVSGEELTRLLGGEELQLDLPLGEQLFVYRLSMEDCAAPLFLTAQKNIWHLRIDKTTLTAFAADLPSRKGIEHEVQLGGAPLMLVLEVDVRRKR
jgi:hypothetical protein